jgi:endoglucanase
MTIGLYWRRMSSWAFRLSHLEVDMPRRNRNYPWTHALRERDDVNVRSPRQHQRRKYQARVAVSGRLRLAALLATGVLAITGCASDGAFPAESTTDGFVQVAGRGLAVNGEPMRLKAVNFSNFYYDDLDVSALRDSTHHSEQDFVQVKELGFNSIRFAIDGNWYLDDRDVFWQWLDRNVAWARQHGVRLILDLHVPIGGYWLDRDNDAYSFDIWSDEELQQQNVDMWREVADRYKDEPAVAAYDLLNEPVTTDSTGDQWKDLAERLVDAVRSVDRNHLLVVGALYGVEGLYGTAGKDAHFQVGDDNVMYDFHFYEPFAYTHQYAGWMPTGDGGRYPDSDVIISSGNPRPLGGSRIATEFLPTGTSGWMEYDSGKITIDDESAAAAVPVAVVDGAMRGTAYFDAVTVTEYAADGTEIRKVVEDPIRGDTALNWYEWQSWDGEAPAAEFARESPGHDDDTSLSITDASAADSIAGWSNDGLLFEVVPGNQYRIQGYMRGESVVGPNGNDPRIHLRLDVFAEEPGPSGGRFLQRDKAYLEDEMKEHLQFGIDHHVPMSVMEFGTIHETFAMEGKGGEQWVTDMLHLLEEKDLSFGYWEYHGPDMGIFLRGPGSPGTANTELQDVLRRELG